MDNAEAGLSAVVWPSDARTFVWRYRFHNKSKKLSLGRASLAEASKRAREARNLRDDGVDPAQLKRSAKVAKGEAARQVELAAATIAHDDIETAVAAFIEGRHKPANRSWREAARLLQKEIIAPWRGRRLGEITRADIHALLDGIADRPAPVLANRIYAHLRTLCRWALARGVIDANPCEGMTRQSRAYGAGVVVGPCRQRLGAGTKRPNQRRKRRSRNDDGRSLYAQAARTQHLPRPSYPRARGG
jgi:hypothetical protein